MDKIKLGGKEINAYFSYPKNKTGPAILVLHAWWGLNEFIKQFCNRLAKEGYFVMAPDYYEGKVATTIDQADNYAGSLDMGVTHALLSNAVDYLSEHKNNTKSQIAVIGFSLGAGEASWLANNNVQINKIVTFYGTGPTDFDKTNASFLCHFADEDPYEGPEYVKIYLDSLHKAGVQVTNYIYPKTHHWFFESDKKDYYKEEASILAWKRTLEFFKA